MLKGGLGDMLMVAQHGGILQEIEFDNTIQGIVTMIKMLMNGELDGFLVTKPTYYYYARETQEQKSLASEVHHVRLMRTEKNFVGDELVGGMLLKEFEDYDYFRKYFESNGPKIQGCFTAQLNAKEKRFKKKENANPIVGLFFPFFLGCLVMLGIILCFGIVYEWRRRKSNGSRRGQLVGWLVCRGVQRSTTPLPRSSVTDNNNMVM